MVDMEAFLARFGERSGRGGGHFLPFLLSPRRLEFVVQRPVYKRAWAPSERIGSLPPAASGQAASEASQRCRLSRTQR